ncbi:MAG: S8 family peptidase [Actinomycetota bacterium]|nr:S8 family peptidase [Actinomycetota bacterium]
MKISRRLAVLSVLALIAAGFVSPVHAKLAPGKRFIVVLRRGAGDPGQVAAEHARAYGAEITKVYHSAIDGYAATIPSSRVAALRADPEVLFLTADGQVSATDQTMGIGVERIHAGSGADKANGVNVAVIDTGIDLRHPDLAANIVGGTNCSSGGPKSYGDVNGHGTHVAGIVAALDNGIGVIGVAPQAKLWSVRVLDKDGFGSWSDVICGIDFVDSKSPANGGPIVVANMSLGGYGHDDGNCGLTNGDAMHMAICRAVGDGVTFTVAAGNSGVDISQALTFVPASYDEVITASALADSDGKSCGAGADTIYAPDDTFAYWSNYATSATDLSHMVAAPGVSIYSTYNGGGYATLSGTSMASPFVAGSAALYISTHSGASPSAVRDALIALGEPVNTNFQSECSGKGQKGRYSHTDPSHTHIEVVLRADSL